MKYSIILFGIVALFFAISILVCTAEVAKADNNQTPDVTWFNPSLNIFEIYSPGQLRGLAELVNNGESFANRTIRLSDNINLGGEDYPFDPIGSTGAPFMGTFDGGYHKVYGLYINIPAQSPAQNSVGLFGSVDREFGTDAHIKNVAVFASITALGSDEVGGIVGRMNGGIIENSFFYGTIRARNSVGGIAGSIMTTAIRNTYSKGVVEGNSRVGGTVGQVNGVAAAISYSFSATAVDGTALVGGIAGDLNEGNLDESVALNSQIVDCANAARIAGGLAVNLANNFAFDKIVYATDNDWEDGVSNNKNGQSIKRDDVLNKQWWQNSTNWNDNIWSFDNNRLPILSGFIGNMVQSGRVDHILPCISQAIVEWADGTAWENGNRFVFNGSPHIPSHESIFVSIDGTTPLRHNIDFDICINIIPEDARESYDRTNVTRDGQNNPLFVSIKIRGLTPYFNGSKILRYFIDPKPLSELNIDMVQDVFYFNGKIQRPVFDVWDGQNKLIEGQDFVIDSDDNVFANTALTPYHEITIRFVGNFTGEATWRYYIRRAKANVAMGVAIDSWIFGYAMNVPRLVGIDYRNENCIYFHFELYGEFSFFVDGVPWATWAAQNIINARAYNNPYNLEVRFNQTDNFDLGNFGVNFMVYPRQREGVPDVPAVSERGYDFILLEGQSGQRVLEFAIRRRGSTDELIWSYSPRFDDNITANTEYEIFARYAAQDSNHLAGEKSMALFVTTARNPLHPLALAAIILGSATAVGASVFAVFFFIAKKKPV